MTMTATEPISTTAPALGVMSPEVKRALAVMGDGQIIGLIDDISQDRPIAYLVAAGQQLQAEVAATMIRDAPGRPVLVLAADRARALGLGKFVPTNSAMPHHLEMIEARTGVTTGVSAGDVARTIRVATNPRSGSSDIVLPGHVTVVRVADGVLTRLGIYEAGYELSRLAGFTGGAVMCPMLDDDGDLASPADLQRWASEEDVPIVSVTDALDARLSSKGLLDIDDETTLDLDGRPARAVTFVDTDLAVRHFALVVGASSGEPVSLSVVEQNPLVDVFDRAHSPVEDALANLRGEEDCVLCYIAPFIQSESDGSRAEEYRRSLLAAKRQAHVVSHMVRLLGVGSIREQRGAGH